MSSPTCLLPADPGIYGPGLRLSLYINWVVILASDIVYTPTRSVFERSVTLLLESAILISVFIQTSKDTLTAIEVYICTLLLSCTLCFHIVSFIWRLITCCREEWDLGLGPTWMNWSTPGRDVLTVVRGFYLVGLVSFEFWFWQDDDRRGRMGAGAGRGEGRCESWVWVFGRRVELGNGGLKSFHLVLYTALVVGAAAVAAVNVVKRRSRRKRDRRDWRRAVRRHSGLDDDTFCLHFARFVLHLVVVAMFIASIEETIHWNNIKDPWAITSSAQLFPLMVSCCLILRVIAKYAGAKLRQAHREEGCSTCSEVSTNRGRPGWPLPRVLEVEEVIVD